MRQSALWIARLWKSTAPAGQPVSLLAPQVFQLPRGGLQLEWCALGSEIEIAIEADGSSTLLVHDPQLAQPLAEEFGPVGDFLLPAALISVFERIVNHVTHAVISG